MTSTSFITEYQTRMQEWHLSVKVVGQTNENGNDHKWGRQRAASGSMHNCISNLDLRDLNVAQPHFLCFDTNQREHAHCITMLASGSFFFMLLLTGELMIAFIVGCTWIVLGQILFIYFCSVQEWRRPRSECVLTKRCWTTSTWATVALCTPWQGLSKTTKSQRWCHWRSSSMPFLMW